MKTLLSVLSALFTVIFAVTALTPVTVNPDDKSDFTPVLRFTVASDTHVDLFAPQRVDRIQKTIKTGYAIADGSKYNKLDAVLFAGDCTDKGYITQFALFQVGIKTVLRDGTKLLAVVAKNHDSGKYSKKSLENIEAITGLPSDFHVVINGFHFIGVSTSNVEDEKYNEYQRTWLSEELKKAADDGAEKPIFLMHHEHVKETVYGSSSFDGWGTDYFTDIIKKYPQIIDFSGHSHYPINDPRSVWQGDFTCFGTGTLNYAEYTVDDVRSYHPEGNSKCGQCWVVEVSADNTVRLRGYDVVANKQICEYTVKNPSDKEHRQYTPELQQSRASAPAFPEGAKLTAVEGANNVTLTIPAADSTDGYPVFIYRAFVYDASSAEVSKGWVLSDTWSAEPRDSYKLTLTASKGQTIKVFAENSYGMQSAPLTYEVK